MPATVVLGLDFGTTRSGIAAFRRESRLNRPPNTFYIVTKYPDDPLPEGNPREFNEQAPSEISYPNPTESESLESLMQEAERGSFDHDESSEAATGEDLSGNDAEIDPPSETDSTTPRGEPTEPEKPQKRSWPDYVRWGFSAKNGSVRFIKLLLDESKASKDVNKETRKQLFLLKRTLLDDNGTGTIIERELDVIVDFLSSLMLHAQEQLQADGYLRADDTVEIVFAVPVAWTQKACRIMESAILEAMTRAGLPTDSIINGDGLLIVSEPEAGATYMLTNEPKIMPHNTFVLVDAGGGTTDATTFGVSQTYPLSLVRETVSPSGIRIGSTDLNRNFAKLLSDRLSPELFKHPEDVSQAIIQELISNALVIFENTVKRRINLKDMKESFLMYKVPGLKRGFRTRENQIIVGMWEYQKVFEKVLAGVWSVVEDQINRCVTKSIKVEYVVLIGGFGDSPALQRYLKLKLARTSKDLGYNIELIEIEAKDSAMAVACGAVLRGLDKDNGPQRHPVSSIGLLGDEQLDMSFPGHRYAWNNRRKHPKLASFSNVDGLAYVRACPEWVIKKDDSKPVPAQFRSKPVPTVLKFRRDEANFIGMVELYVLDGEIPEDHYPKSHLKNKGCYKLGDFDIDMTYAKDEFTTIEPGAGEDLFEPYYEITVGVILGINGRTLSASAEYPLDSGNLVPEHAAKIQRFSIATAFPWQQVRS